MIKPRRSRKSSAVLSKTASASASVADAYLKYSTAMAHRATHHLPLVHGLQSIGMEGAYVNFLIRRSRRSNQDISLMMQGLPGRGYIRRLLDTLLDVLLLLIQGVWRWIEPMCWYFWLMLIWPLVMLLGYILLFGLIGWVVLI